jgi:hypothetical protein
VPPGGAVAWVLSDPSHEKFSETVEDSLLYDPATTVQRDRVGLVNLPGDGWTTMERIRR